MFIPKSVGLSVALLVASICLSSGMDELEGNWEGQLKGSTWQLPLMIGFSKGTAVEFDDGHVRHGTYTLANNRLDISLPKPDNLLIHIVLNKHDIKELKGRFLIEGEPDALAAEINLRRASSAPQTSQPVGMVRACAVADLPKEIQSVLDRYSVQCPVALPSTIAGAEALFASKLFGDLLKAGLGSDFHVDYDGRDFVYLGNKMATAADVESVIRPLLANPDAVRLRPGDAPPRAAAYAGQELGPVHPSIDVRGVLSVKPQYRNGDRINYQEVWAAAVQVARKQRFNLLLPEHIPPYHATTPLVLRSTGPLGLIYESLSIDITDPQMGGQKHSGEYLQIHVVSEVWKKPATSVSKATKIEDECSVSTEGQFKISCSAQPLIEAIVGQITSRGL